MQEYAAIFPYQIDTRLIERASQTVGSDRCLDT
jgi:hypothetical protein